MMLKMVAFLTQYFQENYFPVKQWQAIQCRHLPFGSGRHRDDLVEFEEGLKHVILYDIETHSGELNI